MMDFYKDNCTGDICAASAFSLSDHDPMVEEALVACAESVNRLLSFSPPDILVEEIHSPIYTPSAANGGKIAALNEEAAALGYNNVIHFRPPAQCEVDGQLITAGITEQEADMILEERRNNVVESIFVPCEQPILDTPADQKQQAKVLGRVKTVKTARGGGVRRSSRQKAKVSSVPVSKRATHRLMKAFGVIGPDEPIGDHAMEAFAKRFNSPLSPEAIAAIRSLTSLDSATAMAASAQLVASEGADTMQEVGL
jgi:hypothetical protein